MPKAIRSDSENNRTTGLATVSLYDGAPATVAQQVHDGDTINVTAKGNIAVRLLGIDTPEVSFAFPGPKLNFVNMDNPRWNEFLKSPFDAKWGPYGEIPDGLRSFILAKLTGEPGTEHKAHADRATETFRNLVSKDMEIMGQDLSSFGYYLRFGFEVMDAYGRFLCTINRNQPRRTEPTPRPPTYNMRLLERGMAFPYFIWPNVNPFDRPASISAAVIPPGTAREFAENDTEVSWARRRVQTAREKHLGLFDMTSPLLLEPFELRFLCRRSIPGRHLIDLSSDSKKLIAPQEYFTVPHPEDRLWIPDHYVPLFKEAGWEI